MPRKRNLIISPVGKEFSYYRDWIRGKRDFDLMLVNYGGQKDQGREDAEYYFEAEGFKLEILKDAIDAYREVVESYDAVWLPDGDLAVETAAINRLFGMFHRYRLDLAQPAIRGFPTTTFSERKKVCKLRYVNYIEMMCPLFRTSVLQEVLDTFKWLRSGWGVDWVWSKRLENRRLAIIDDVVVEHTKPVSPERGNYYRKLAACGVRAQTELDAILKEHNITKKYQAYDCRWQWWASPLGFFPYKVRRFVLSGGRRKKPIRTDNPGPDIYVLCPDDLCPRGGYKQLYRHVDLLNRNGFSAFIVHAQEGFRCAFFENQTRVAYHPTLCPKVFGPKKRGWRSWAGKISRAFSKAFPSSSSHAIKIENKDYLVIPETYGPRLGDLAPGVRKVVFNQNSHYTFWGYPLEPGDLTTAYRERDVMATLVISDHNLSYLRHVFPGHRFRRIHYGVDSRLFYYPDRKKKQIAFMPRKLPEEVRQVINVLKFRNALKDFELIEIREMKEAETAEILRDSLIFLSFSAQEGCPLPPMEAMACGCVVIGYHGGGGEEYFKEEFCYPVPAGDILGFAKTVEEVVELFRQNHQPLFEKGRRASEFILREYSLEREESEIVQFWKEMMNLPRSGNYHENCVCDSLRPV